MEYIININFLPLYLKLSLTIISDIKTTCFVFDRMLSILADDQILLFPTTCICLSPIINLTSVISLG